MTEKETKNLPAVKDLSLREGIAPKDFDELTRFANLVSKAQLAPKGFDTIEKVAIGILTNMELGRPIITGLQDLAIINGRCGIYGDASLAMITASGYMADGYPIEEETGTPYKPDWTFTFKVRRRSSELGGKAGPERIGKWTWEDSIRAGFHDPKTKSGGKDVWSPWARFPRRMMQWKARNFVLRDTFGDVLKGMKTVEDLHDLDGIPTLTPSANGQYTTDDLTEKLQQGAKEAFRDKNVEKTQEPEILSPEVEPEIVDPPPSEEPEIVKPPVKEKCPWPECRVKCKPGKGMATHITRTHKKMWPPKIYTPAEPDPEPEDETNIFDDPEITGDAGIPRPSEMDMDDDPPLFNDNGSINQSVAEKEIEKARELSGQNKLVLSIKDDFSPEVRKLAFRRVGLGDSPHLSTMPISIVEEAYEMCQIVEKELAEGKH